MPIGWIAVGDPAPLFAPEAHDEREEAAMERVATRYADSFGRHRDDRIIEN